MRRTAEKIGGDFATDCFARAEPLPQLAGLAPAALTLPELTAPKRVVLTNNNPWWTGVAIALLDAGMVDPEAVNMDRIDAAEIARNALNDWIGKRLGNLRHIGLNINLSDNLDNAVRFSFDEESVAEIRKMPLLVSDKPRFYLGNEPTDWGFVRLEGAFNALESCAKGLGETVWFHLDRWLMGTNLNAYTPCRALDDQCNYSWWGNDDESEVVAQYNSVDEFQESGCLTRAEFDAQLPPQVVRAKCVLSFKKMKEIMHSETTGASERALLGLFFKIHARIGKREFDVFSSLGLNESTDDYLQQIAPAVFVRWNNADPVTDIFDDMAQAYQNGGEGYYEGAMGFDCFALDDPEAIREWMKKADRYFTVIGMLDQLLSLIEGYNDDE